MSPQTFVFVGRSGCGKGTQADLLQKFLRERDPQTKMFYLETGERFREFIASPGYSNELAKNVQDTGGLQPAFLAVWLWADLLIKNVEANEHIFVDGTPRKLGEAITFTEAMKFYSRTPYVIYLDVSRKWSEDRLKERQRLDDIPLSIKKRLDWFETDVLPAIEYFRTSPDVVFFDVKAEKSIDEVHRDILERISW